MVDVLSAEMLYPDCPGCETNLFTDLESRTDELFVCKRCGEAFHPSPTSEWRGIGSLSKVQYRDYVGIDIRGYKAVKWSQRAGEKTAVVCSNVRRARQKIKEERFTEVEA